MKETTKKELQIAACKVCTSGCIASFDCGKTKSTLGTIPLFGSNIVCPLAKFNVDHSKEKTDLIESLKNQPTLDDLYMLCEFCEHRDTTNDTDDSFSKENCFESYCIDCPVQSCIDNVLECIAEGAMS